MGGARAIGGPRAMGGARPLPPMGHPIAGEHPHDTAEPAGLAASHATMDGSRGVHDSRMSRPARADRPARAAVRPAGVARAACDTGAVKLELTRRSAYAIRAGLALAHNGAGAVVPASRIAREMHIPVRFLPQVLGDLTRAGIVEARLGRSGGYRLAKPPGEVSLLDLIEATEGDARRRTCVLTGRSCGDEEPACDVHEVFLAAQVALLGRLAQASLADILAGSDHALPIAAWVAAVPGVRPVPFERRAS